MSRIFDFLLAFSIYYHTFLIVRLAIKVKRLEYLFYALGMFSFSLIFVSNYIDYAFNHFGYVFDETLLQDWSSVTGIALILSGLAYLIYDSKPPFARFPMSLSYLPLLIIPAYYFAMNTLVLKDWLISIYQGGALIVAILMSSALIRKKLDYIILLIGYLIIAAAYVLHWYAISLHESSDWIWKSFLIAGMFILFHGFNKLETPEEEAETGLANPYSNYHQ
ncbi:hypothetical protein EP331_07695 [bacterium]|nr:MAG: hypothetical protein EP331_07695 [bacterium]